jgi:uncharacterized cofD-like protein
MKDSFSYRLQTLMLPGLKRWIVIILLGITFIVLGVFLLLGYHPITVSGLFLREIMEHAADVLPHRISGIIILTAGAVVIYTAVAGLMSSILGAYLPEDRESIPDMLYRRHHLDRGPKVVVIGGGTGLANLLKGLKKYTNKITAVVTVGDDGGSSGRLREELGVLPPGDIRNCITALAEEEKLVTQLFHYRFQSGQGLEGHSFGNLFLTAIYAITKGDMLEAVRVASRVLNSCGQVLPSTLTNITLVAEMHDGRIIQGESKISKDGGQIARISSTPVAHAIPEAILAIGEADLIILGPGSLYTSVIPNLLIKGIPEAISRAKAKKLYVCNVMTQPGETVDYSVADHIEAIRSHADTEPSMTRKLLQAVLVNDQAPSILESNPLCAPVRYDPERIEELGITPIRKALINETVSSHHDSAKLAEVIMLWFFNRKDEHEPSSKVKTEDSATERRTAGSRA